MDSNSWRNSGNSWKQNTVSSWHRGQEWDESPSYRGGFRGRIRGGFRGGFRGNSRGNFRGRGRGRGGSVLAVPILPHHNEAKKEEPRNVKEEEDDILEETETTKTKMEEMVKKQLEMLSKTDVSDNYEQDEYDDDDYFEEPAIKKKVEDIVDTSARPLVLATDPKLEQLLQEAKKTEETKQTFPQKNSKNRQENPTAKDNQHIKKEGRYNSNSWINVYKQRVDSLKNNIMYDQSKPSQQQQQNSSQIEKYQNVLKKMCSAGPSSAPYNGPSAPFNGPVNPTQNSPDDGIPIPYNGPVLTPQITPFDDLDTRRSKIQAPSLVDPLAASKRFSRFDKPPQASFNGPVSSTAVSSGAPFNGPIQTPFNGPVSTTPTNVPFNRPFSAPFNGPVPHASPFGIHQGSHEAGASSGFFFSDSVAQRPNYRAGGRKGDETKKRKSGEPLILPKSAPKPLYAALTGQVQGDEESREEEDDLAIAKLREIMKIAKSSR